MCFSSSKYFIFAINYNHNNKLKARTLAYIELFLAAVTWSSLFLFLKELEVAGIEPGNIIAARMILASLLIAFIALPMKLKHPALKDIPLLLVPGVSFFIGAVLIASGEEGQSPGITAFIGFFVPIIISLFLLGKLHIKMNHLGIAALVIAVLGLVMTGFGDEINPDFSLFIIFVGACFAGVYFVFQKFLVKKHGPYVVTCYSMWGALPVALFFMPSFIEQTSLMTGDSWMMLFGVTVVATLIPFFLYTHAMKELGPAQGTAINLLIPFFGSLLAFIVDGFTLSLITLVGGFITIFGVCIYVFKGLERTEEA
jgi:drug/metabolite transporter (DMT)-like permease